MPLRFDCTEILRHYTPGTKYTVLFKLVVEITVCIGNFMYTKITAVIAAFVQYVNLYCLYNVLVCTIYIGTLGPNIVPILLSQEIFQIKYQ